MARRSAGPRIRGFTLIELLVVISIIGLLSSVVLTSLNTARAKARDAARVTAIREVQKALAVYYISNNGTYPTTNAWRGSNPDCYGDHGDAMAPGLVPAFMPKMPLEPNQRWTGGCFLYYSNGVDYKYMAHGTMETCTSNCPLQDPVRQNSSAIYSSSVSASW